ncbi:MAG TPA: DUF2090 domain-containing protein, partial [Actinomycetota bacterium]|nr:DUF2090 domain-containing protein [Actinomycetota bacterium]
PPPDRARLSDGKRLIYDGFVQAIAEGTETSAAGILVDEEFGADIARAARQAGHLLAMPVEKSGQDEFDFEYEDWTDHISRFDPSFSKVLVRYNPDGDGEMNARQAERLQRLGDWLHQNSRLFLFELLVPAEAAQLESVGGDEGRYDTEVRPALMVRAIAELQEAGVDPDIWKIEGIDAREDCERISAQTRSGQERENVACVVLGRGADDAAVDHWLKMGSGVPGYVGFAIGRTIWNKPLKAFIAGDADRETAAKQIAANYRRFIDVYESAS